MNDQTFGWHSISQILLHNSTETRFEPSLLKSFCVILRCRYTDFTVTSSVGVYGHMSSTIFLTNLVGMHWIHSSYNHDRWSRTMLGFQSMSSFEHRTHFHIIEMWRPHWNSSIRDVWYTRVPKYAHALSWMRSQPRQSPWLRSIDP